MMSAVTVTTVEQFIHNTTPSFEDKSFVHTVVKNMGLCVEVTDYIAWVLRVNAIVRTAVSLPGIVGAALSLGVTCRQQNRSSVSVQVALLSLYDLVFLTTVLLLALFHLADVSDEMTISLFLALQQLAHWGFTYTMVDISVERCLAIDRPFLARRVCGVGFTLKRAAIILAVGLAFVVPFILDLIFSFSTERECEKEMRSLTLFGVVFTLYIVVVFFFLFPFTCILVVNARLVFALRHVGERTSALNAISSSSSCSQADISAAKQLSAFVIGMSVWYGTCMLAPSILFLVRLTRIELFHPESDITVAVVADTLVVLSAAANFVFYFLLWRNFRHTFLDMFCSRCRSADLNHSSSDQLSSRQNLGSSNSDHLPPRQVTSPLPVLLTVSAVHTSHRS